MPFITLRQARNLKDMVLIVTVVYFYALAVAINFERPTYGADDPATFLAMTVLYLVAVGFEIVASWWEKRKLIIWIILWAASYVVLGLYVAPRFFGDEILPYVYLEPLVIVFIGGFAYAYGKIFSQQIVHETKLSPEHLRQELERMPGWTVETNALSKTFEFLDFPEALNFVNQVARIAEDMEHHPTVIIRQHTVEIHLTSKEAHGVAMRDIEAARKIDAEEE